MSWPVAVTCFGPVQGGTLLWTHEGALRVTLILRTAFGLAPGQLTQAPAGAVERGDQHYQNDPARPIRTPADVAPRVPRSEVVHAGKVIAPAGVTMVRLSLLRAGKALFDKRVLASTKNDSPGLGPIGAGSPERSAILRGHPEPRSSAHTSGPAEGLYALAVTDGFDFGFYQAAPLDQQVDGLVGGDQILVGNLHPDLPELSVLVPNRAPIARAMLGRQEAPIPLACRRIVLDTDRRVYTLVWYGELELPGPKAVPLLRIEARAPELVVAPQVDAREMLGRIAASPATAAGARNAAPVETGPVRRTGAGTVVIGEQTVPPPAPAPPTPPPRAAPLGTMMVDDDAPPAPARAALPFFGAPPPPRPPADSSSNLATPWGAPVKPAPKAAATFAGTLAVDDDPPPARLPPPPAPPPPEDVEPPPVAARPPVADAKPEPRAAAAEPAPSPWKQPDPEPRKRSVRPAPPPRPKGPAAATTTLKKDGNERFRKR